MSIQFTSKNNPHLRCLHDAFEWMDGCFFFLFGFVLFAVVGRIYSLFNFMSNGKPLALLSEYQICSTNAMWISYYTLDINAEHFGTLLWLFDLWLEKWVQIMMHIYVHLLNFIDIKSIFPYSFLSLFICCFCFVSIWVCV